MNNVIMYGIKNCDTIKKAKKWLEANDINYTFHDYRVDGIDKPWLESVVEHLDWELVLNKRGTTYRQLEDEVKNNLTESLAIEKMVEQPAMIKRPIVIIDGQHYHLGFKDAQYQEIFKA